MHFFFFSELGYSLINLGFGKKSKKIKLMTSVFNFLSNLKLIFIIFSIFSNDIRLVIMLVNIKRIPRDMLILVGIIEPDVVFLPFFSLFNQRLLYPVQVLPWSLRLHCWLISALNHTIYLI